MDLCRETADEHEPDLCIQQLPEEPIRVQERILTHSATRRSERRSST